MSLWLGVGCTGTTGHLALATTRGAELQLLDADPSPTRHVVGYSCVRVFFVVPEGMPKIGAAIDDALEKTGARVLTNVNVRYAIFDIPFVYGVACYVAEGDAR